jgi:hypothetical protein
MSQRQIESVNSSKVEKSRKLRKGRTREEKKLDDSLQEKSQPKSVLKKREPSQVIIEEEPEPKSKRTGKSVKAVAKQQAAESLA